jgi:hypothetical protein
MKKSKMIKIVAAVMITALLIGGGIGAYMFFKPHRDVQKTSTDFKLTANELVAEYLGDWQGANNKYLAADGDSKVLEITGTVARVSEDFSGRKVVLLQEKGQKAGVNCTFLPETDAQAAALNTGDVVTIKGVIRSGASFDADLDMYVHAVVEKSAIVQ